MELTLTGKTHYYACNVQISALNVIVRLFALNVNLAIIWTPVFNVLIVIIYKIALNVSME